MEARRFDAFDHTVRSRRVDDDPVAHRFNCLMVSRIDSEGFCAADAMKKRALGERDLVSRLIAWIGLFMSQGLIDFVGDVLDEVAAKNHVQELLSTADTEYGKIAFQSALRYGQFELCAPAFRSDSFVSAVHPEKRRVDVEGAAGDDQAIELIKVVFCQFRFVRQGDGQTIGFYNRIAIVLAQRVPGKFRPAARLFGIQSQTDGRATLC